MNSWPIRRPVLVGSIDLYGQRSLPQMQERVILTMASVGSVSSGSGTLATKGTFTYNAGLFFGRLSSYGTAVFNADFNPGNGTPVMSVADGVVVLATEDGGGLGVNVEVQHNIGGELVTTSYGHMQYGSLQVSEGQQITAGQQIGLVGTTGQSTGPHLHLEMFGADGVRFDGFAWLSEHVNA